MRLVLAFLFSILLIGSGRAQERVNNVRIQVIDASQLEIRYDLINARPGDSLYLQIESRPRGELQILPEFVRGDIGTRITAGSDRRIVWDALANGYTLDEDIRATVLVKAGSPITLDQPAPSTPTVIQKPTATPAPTEPAAVAQPKAVDPDTSVGSASVTTPSTGTNRAAASADSVRFRRNRYAGPAWALLSAVAPGMGNVFVQTPKPKVGLRPLLTVGCYGLVVYGLMERQKALDEYATYEQQKNRTAAEPYYQTANNHYHTYFLATRGAVVVAAVDVILTFVKGLRNSRSTSRPVQSVRVRPGVQAGQLTAVLQYSF